MANNKENKAHKAKEETSESKQEGVNKLAEVISETAKVADTSSKKKNKTPKKEAPAKKKTKLEPYVHIDTFLQTAIPYYKLSRVQASGFKIKMNGRHYQRDEKVFVDEMKKHLNIK